MISIHAPPRGATSSASRRTRGTYFNSRPSARGDVFSDMLELLPNISIHAPPRGATRNGYACRVVMGIFQFTPLREGRHAAVVRGRESRHHFNSRPSARGDRFASHTSFAFCRFQFTPLREGRRFFRYAGTAAEHFNSRPSARGDFCFVLRALPCNLFQFTPLREGRRQQKICNFCKSFVQPLQISMA